MSAPRTIEAACRDRVGFVDYEDGIPVVLRWRCRNTKCCPRREGMVAIHRLTLYGTQNGKRVGEMTTSYEPLRPLSDLLRLHQAGGVPDERRTG